MNNAQINRMRNLAECLCPDGKYEVVIYTRDVKAFNLPLDRAQHWASFYPGAVVEERKGV